MSSTNDPLELGGLDPQAILGKIQERDTKGKQKVPTELELQKEARLAEKEKRMSSVSKATKYTPEAPPTAPPPSQVDKSLLLDKIAAYRDRFPNLKKRNNVSAKSSVEELFDELHYLELQLGSSPGSNNFSAMMLQGTMMGIEVFARDYWNPLGLNLNGLGTVTQQNIAEFQPILDELMIKHNAGMYTSPEWRLALALGATVITVHGANNNPEVARAVKGMSMAVNPPSSAKDL